jgi:hypothetical protein
VELPDDHFYPPTESGASPPVWVRHGTDPHQPKPKKGTRKLFVFSLGWNDVVLLGYLLLPSLCDLSCGVEETNSFSCTLTIQREERDNPIGQDPPHQEERTETRTTTSLQNETGSTSPTPPPPIGFGGVGGNTRKRPNNIKTGINATIALTTRATSTYTRNRIR